MPASLAVSIGEEPRAPQSVVRPVRVAVLATITDFGGIERVLLTQLENSDPSIQAFPILFSRQDAANASFLDRLRTMDVPHVLFMNTRKRRYFNVVRNLRDALSVFKQQRFDVVHSHGYRANLLGLAAAALYGLPVVSTCHGYVNTDSSLKFNSRFDTLLLRRFTRVVAVSAAMKETLVADGVPESKIDVITNAVQTELPQLRGTIRQELRRSLGVEDSEFVFGFVGRLSDEKGVDYLVQAAARLAAHQTSWRVLVVGDGDARRSLESAVTQRGLKAKVIFAGFQSDTAPWYAAMDAFVLPSLTEGTPMALLEAMSYQLPVIATHVGGVPKVLTQGENGLLVAPADPAALASAMQRVLEDNGLRSTLASGALRTVRDAYDVRAWTRQLNQVYTKAVREHRGA